MPAAPRRRLGTAERYRQILDGAIQFFSVHGFDGQLRDLAHSIGVTHALLYHYFPTKQALIDSVYREVFEGRWNPSWEALLDDRDLAVGDKFITFYEDYSRTVLTPEFVRILVYSGLGDRTITDRFFALLGDRLFPKLIRETRRFRGSRSRRPTTAREHELLMGLHGGIFYNGLRRFVYGQAMHPAGPPVDDAQTIRDRVQAYLQASLQLDPRPQ